MSEAAKETRIDPISSDGLEDVFEYGQHTVIDNDENAVQTVFTIDQHPDQWTIAEAAIHLNVSIGTIRRRLQTGKLKGFKIEGANGPEWRVIPHAQAMDTVINLSEDRVHAVASRPDHGPHTVIKNGHHGVQTFDHHPDHVSEHLDVIREMQLKLETLTYRNGYLEAQLENHKETIKLLTDSQHKRGSWSRFWSWFTGS